MKMHKNNVLMSCIFRDLIEYALIIYPAKECPIGDDIFVTPDENHE
jgi:hypothetical protein